MTIVVVSEKPSVARDIAAVLGATARDGGCFRGNGYAVTWAIGHLVTLAEPHQVDPRWKAWRREQLPMLPAQWPLVVLDQTRDQYEVVRRLINDRGTKSVVCATDAGREGELIFRLIYEAAECKKPVERLWISSLTPDAIRAGFRALKPGRDYNPLADAARGRSQADWLVGMNLTRAYTLVHGGSDELLSVGRVQTPTLALLVDRELEIRAFVPEAYLEVWAEFGPKPSYRGTYFAGAPANVEQTRAAMRLPADGAEAEAVARRVREAGRGVIESVERETKRMASPLLYDLTELQRHANRLFGFSAAKTLELAQALYESRKLISYPRTDSRHLSTEIATTLPDVVKAIGPQYPGLALDPTPLGRRFVDDAKVGDHHAIIPTTRVAGELPRDEERIYDLICRRLLQAWYPDHVWAVTTVITAVNADRFFTTGSAVVEPGWKVLDIQPQKKKDEPPELPSGLERGQARTVDAVEVEKKETRPPKRLTEATLLTAMESAGRTLEDKELSAAMRDSGLGTPATRASIIETLLTREFIAREDKALHATDKGIRLISLVDPEVKSAIMTGRWEQRLRSIERKQDALAPFMREIEAWVTEVVGRTKSQAPAPAPMSAPPSEPLPERTRDPRALLREVFGHTEFRPHQEEVCRALVAGQDALLVMPTGAGKSICYQLPALARGGCGLVISPLIALMEDQVAKLQAVGIRAARIHSGRPREESRQVCKDYLAGQLELLFIAPERLGVRGFPELLARRKPSLIAVDEAHCISEWGHDFRPDYRLLAERLPQLGPAPVIGLTATATPRVQDDIVAQLHLERGRRFIHGFRRTNIAIEVVEVPKPNRADVALRLLSDPAHRPAIVYAPSRKEADSLSETLGRSFKTAKYHAGMSTKARDEAQTAFLGGKVEVVVATIAFGMGVDKADVRTVLHLALPGTVEGYYQEIGRAGRDGKPSRAVLLHSFVDHKLHEMFREREYPDTAVLTKIYRALGDALEPTDDVRARIRMSQDEFEAALEKLWIHGGARVEDGESVARGHDRWRASYEIQHAHRVSQIEEIDRYTKSRGCRMVRLVRHFGDQEDSGEPCGVCDQCAPASCVAQRMSAPSSTEKLALRNILDSLRQRGPRSAGVLHREVFGEGLVDRKAFERLLSGLARAELVDVFEEEFEKDGQWITYQKVALTAHGRESSELSSLLLPEREAPHAPKSKSKSKRSSKGRARRAEPTPVTATPSSSALRQWRLEQARSSKVPAFRVLTDRALEAIVQAKPQDEATLLQIPGAKTAKKHARAILAVLSGVLSPPRAGSTPAGGAAGRSRPRGKAPSPKPRPRPGGPA